MKKSLYLILCLLLLMVVGMTANAAETQQNQVKENANVASDEGTVAPATPLTSDQNKVAVQNLQESVPQALNVEGEAVQSQSSVTEGVATTATASSGCLNTVGETITAESLQSFAVQRITVQMVLKCPSATLFVENAFHSTHAGHSVLKCPSVAAHNVVTAVSIAAVSSALATT